MCALISFGMKKIYLSCPQDLRQTIYSFILFSVKKNKTLGKTVDINPFLLTPAQIHLRNHNASSPLISWYSSYSHWTLFRNLYPVASPWWWDCSESVDPQIMWAVLQSYVSALFLATDGLCCISLSGGQFLIILVSAPHKPLCPYYVCSNAALRILYSVNVWFLVVVWRKTAHGQMVTICWQQLKE